MFRATLTDRRGGTVRVTPLPGWAVGLGAIGIGIVGFLVLLLGAGLALLLAPVAIGAFLIARWRLRRVLADILAQAGMQRPPRPQDDPHVIDAEYRVIRDDGRG